jgi:hypothetical protein
MRSLPCLSAFLVLTLIASHVNVAAQEISYRRYDCSNKNLDYMVCGPTCKSTAISMRFLVSVSNARVLVLETVYDKVISSTGMEECTVIDTFNFKCENSKKTPNMEILLLGDQGYGTIKKHLAGDAYFCLKKEH